MVLYCPNIASSPIYTQHTAESSSSVSLTHSLTVTIHYHILYKNKYYNTIIIIHPGASHYIHSSHLSYGSHSAQSDNPEGIAIREDPMPA